MDAQTQDRRARHLEILNEVARIATLDLELRPMLQNITDTLAHKFNWEFVALITVNPERTAFLCEAMTTAAATEVHVGYTRPLGSGVVGTVAATERPLLIDDVRTFPNYVETMIGALSEACIPIKHKGRLVAIMNLESTRVAEFHDSLPLMLTVADQIAGAIANARMYDELLSANEKLAELTAQLEHKTGALEEANAHLAKAIETLHRISTMDGLTEVANRRLFDETLALEWRRGARAKMALSLLIVDIDHFKRYNDEHGHQAGDECLRAVARTLQGSVHRAADCVARYGGEEFVVLLPDTESDRAWQIAELIRSRVEGLEMDVTVSIGVTTTVPDRDLAHADEFVKKADDALYEAKRRGRNRVV
jgi:diguanylate cyclase (GGDEF)-like protein